MAWKLVLTDLDGTAIGEVLNAKDRRVWLPFKSFGGFPTVSFTLRLDNPLATEITDRLGDVLVKVYQGTALRLVADLTTAEEVGQEGTHTLACVFAGPPWRLLKRLCGKSSGGVSYANEDRAVIVTDLLADANADRDIGYRAGSIVSPYSMSLGPVYFKPIAEALTELAAIAAYPFEAPGSWPVSDNFTIAAEIPLAVATGGGPRALDAPAGQYWGAVGDPNDYFVHASDYCYRTDVGDTGQPSVPNPGGLGRWAIAGSNSYTNVMVECDFNHSTIVGAKSGVVARWAGLDNLLVARWTIGPDTSVFEVVKVKGSVGAGVATILASQTVGLIPTTQWSSIRLRVDADGRWWAWSFPISLAAGQPILAGQDADLATGGALATGGIGIYDENASADACVRYYDQFLAGVPAMAMTPVMADYEFVPAEPSIADPKVATLNMAATLGTTRPVVFEYGAGNRSIRSYRRVISREGLLNYAVSLPSGFPTDINFVTATDAASITARGRFEEVVSSDFGNISLRQALIDEHVAVRATARQIVTFDPSSTAPVFGTDYFVGDYVTARVSVDGDVRLPDGQVRVYGVEISIDDEGKETVVPTLVPEA